MQKLIRTVLPFHASAWDAVSAPIQCLIEADDLAERERLTTLWYSTTQSHLQFVSVTVSLDLPRSCSC